MTRTSWRVELTVSCDESWDEELVKEAVTTEVEGDLLSDCRVLRVDSEKWCHYCLEAGGYKNPGTHFHEFGGWLCKDHYERRTGRIP